MSNLETNTTDLQSILNKVRNLPAAGGGSSVQPDWNQNDPDAADYIKNRPCGDIGKVYLIPEGTMTSEATVDDPPTAISELPSLDGIDFDSPIHININGVEYERNFVEWEFVPGIYYYCFGNTSLMFGKGSNGDPFMGMVGVNPIESGDIVYMAMIACIEETTSIPVSVWQDGFKTLDIKYLPKHLQCGETITGRVKDITWDGNLEGYEYQSLEMDGQTVYVVKMSDATPDIVHLQGGTVTFTTPEGSQNIDITSDALYDYRDNADSPMPCVMISEVAVVCFDTVNFMGMQLSKGIYFMKSGETYVSELHLVLEYTISEIKKIDGKFIDLDWSPNPISVTRTNILPETANVISGNDIEGLTSEIIETLSEVAVILDGVEYILTPYIYKDNFPSDDFICAGNISLLNPAFPGSATIPFLLLFGTSSVRFIMINPDGTTTDENPHTIQIDGIVKKYETIPDRLLPEKLQKSAGRVVEYECYYTDTSGYTKRAQNGAEIFNDYTNNKAIGQNSHAEGYNTVAFGVTSHAEGQSTLAYGAGSHAEGTSTKARGSQSHAEGFNTTASGNYSHAEGYTTIATGGYQHVQGRYNVEDKENKYAHIVGNGDYSTCSNAHTLDWSGNAWFAGEVYVCGTSQNDALKLSPITEDTTEILPETTCTFNNAMSDGYSDTTVTLNTDFVVGEKYDVCWDGTWYCDLTARKIANERYIAGIVDGYNFGVLYNNTSGDCTVETYVSASGETHTIKVVQSKGVTATIDNKPIQLATKAYVEALEKEIAELRTLVQQLTNS